MAIQQSMLTPVRTLDDEAIAIDVGVGAYVLKYGPFSTHVTPHGFLRRSVLLPTGHLRLRSEPVPLHSPHFVFAGKEDVPREFTTTSRVIMIAKDWQTLSPG